MTQRVFTVADHLQPRDGEPIRSLVHETDDAAIVAWTVIQGEGEYQVDASGSTVRLAAGDIAVAPVGAVHGVLNTGSVDLVFVSVVSPALSGFQAL